MTTHLIRFGPIALVIAVCVGSIGCAARQAREPSGPSFTVMTFNVYLGLEKTRELVAPWTDEQASSTIEAIRLADPDIVSVQESDEAWWQRVSERLPNRYPHKLRRKDRRGGGFVIMSKWPFEEIAHIDPLDDECWHSALLLKMDTPLGPVRVLAVHLTPPLELDHSIEPDTLVRTASVREREMRHLAKHVIGVERPAIVMGDFNEGDDGLAVAHLREHGFVDALPLYAPMADTWSWPMFGPIGFGRRLDHVMYNAPIDPVNSWTVEAEGTDHSGVLVTFERSAGAVGNIE